MAPAFNVPMNKGATMGGGGGLNSKRGPLKIDKSQISSPTNFKHVVHIGWNEQQGFDLTGDEVKTLRPFLEKAGVSERQLCDRDTRDFIYEFVKTNNVLEKVTPEPEGSEADSIVSHSPSKSRPPPPVPSRQNHRTNGSRVAPPPPPPPSSSRVQQHQQKVRGPPPGRPSPPVPQNNNAGQVGGAAAPPAPPPPPPPPPPPQMPGSGPGDVTRIVPEIKTPMPGVPDTRNALLDDIRKGATLKVRGVVMV